MNVHTPLLRKLLTLESCTGLSVPGNRSSTQVVRDEKSKATVNSSLLWIPNSSQQLGEGALRGALRDVKAQCRRVSVRLNCLNKNIMVYAGGAVGQWCYKGWHLPCAGRLREETWIEVWWTGGRNYNGLAEGENYLHKNLTKWKMIWALFLDGRCLGRLYYWQNIPVIIGTLKISSWGSFTVVGIKFWHWKWGISWETMMVRRY